MNRGRTALVVALAGGLAACAIGSRPRDYPIATMPAGAFVEIRTRAGALGPHELLAVQDSGLMVADSNAQLVFVEYSKLRALNIPKYGSWFSSHQPPAPAVREQWRVVARYPQGISPALLQQLVQLTGVAVRRLP